MESNCKVAEGGHGSTLSRGELEEHNPVPNKTCSGCLTATADFIVRLLTIIVF